jgi:hypothetical protein
MNNQKNKTENSRLPEIGAIILVLGAIGYYFYSGGSAAPTSSSFTVSSDNSVVGSDVLSLLDQIQSLRIDTTLFQSPVYQSLTDFTVPIPPENIGKANPFLPIGTTGGGISTSTSGN